MFMLVFQTQIRNSAGNSDSIIPDSKVHGANKGPTWVLSAPDGPMLAPWTLLSGIWVVIYCQISQNITPSITMTDHRSDSIPDPGIPYRPSWTSYPVSLWTCLLKTSIRLHCDVAMYRVVSSVDSLHWAGASHGNGITDSIWVGTHNMFEVCTGDVWHMKIGNQTPWWLQQSVIVIFPQ